MSATRPAPVPAQPPAPAPRRRREILPLPWRDVVVARTLHQRLVGAAWLLLTTTPWWPTEVTPDLRAGVPLALVAFLAVWFGVDRVRGRLTPYLALLTLMGAAYAQMLWYIARGDGSNAPLTNVLVALWLVLYVWAVESRARDVVLRTGTNSPTR